MKDNLTELSVILDKSGSMGHLTDETLSSFNNFVKEQKQLPGEANLTVILFDTDKSVLIDRMKLSEVPDEALDRTNYWPGGYTALYDAMGFAIDSLGKKLADMPEADRPGKVLVVTITDGEENSSREYKHGDIKSKVTTQQDAYKWEFLYLGTTLEQMAQGADLGTRSHNMMQYSADASGIRCAYDATSRYAKAFRSGVKAALNSPDPVN